MTRNVARCLVDNAGLITSYAWPWTKTRGPHHWELQSSSVDGNFGAGCNGQDSGASSLAARCAADCEALVSTISELLMSV
jgi:hypothetical protein